jgi:hypothetical protein
MVVSLLNDRKARGLPRDIITQKKEKGKRKEKDKLSFESLQCTPYTFPRGEGGRP